MNNKPIWNLTFIDSRNLTCETRTVEAHNALEAIAHARCRSLLYSTADLVILAEEKGGLCLGTALQQLLHAHKV